jgi:hypothetical protein
LIEYALSGLPGAGLYFFFLCARGTSSLFATQSLRSMACHRMSFAVLAKQTQLARECEDDPGLPVPDAWLCNPAQAK